MAIYKSSYNKNKKKKQAKEQEQKPTKKQIKVNKHLIVLVVCLSLFFVCILPNNFAKSFLLGVFGLAVYPLTLIFAFFSAVFMGKKKYKVKKKYVTYLSVALSICWFIFHIILTSKLSTSSFGVYLKETYKAKTTGGGLLLSLVSYPLVKYLTYVGAYIVCAVALAIFVGLIIDYINNERNNVNTKPQIDFTQLEDFAEETPKVEPKNDLKKDARRKLGLDKNDTTIISSTMPTFDVNIKKEKPLSKREYILTPLDPVIPTENTNEIFNSSNSQKNNSANQQVKIANNSYFQQLDNQIQQTEKEDVIVDEEDLSGYKTAFETNTEDNLENEETEETNSSFDKEDEIEEELENLNDETEDYVEDEPNEETSQIEEITANVEESDFVDEYADNHNDELLGDTVHTEVVKPSVDISQFHLPNQVKKTVVEEPAKVEPKQKQEIPPYIAPPVDLLNYIENTTRISDEELQDNIERLEQVLEDFKVPAKVNNVQVGPAVTRYELTMPRGISVNKVAQMADDIAMTLASNGAIRVEAPIPGKNSVGIEVPNKQVTAVSLRELIDSEDFRVRGNPLSFVLGKDINGDIVFCNLDKMPHILVAGSTGSGKSVCLNTMLLSMCYKSGPQDLRLILIDPKMVEFATYNELPHLLIPEVITGKDMAINALDWAIKEMERRYALFAKNHVVNINEFNKSEIVKNGKEEKLPFIVIVVDELADLMLEAKREIDDRIAKIAAKARAAGIHLVIATQRPSVDVITGTVKANLPSRIAFALTNYMDSKTILDGGGAEKLLGKGDMLFKPQDKPEPRRIQGAFVSNQEISAVVQFIKENNKPVYDDDAGEAIKNPKQEKSQFKDNTGEPNQPDFDPVLKDALKWFIQVKQASASMIARRFSVGFNRAGRIMDQMEDAGFIGHQDGSKPRSVLISMEQFNEIFGEDE